MVELDPSDCAADAADAAVSQVAASDRKRRRPLPRPLCRTNTSLRVRLPLALHAVGIEPFPLLERLIRTRSSRHKLCLRSCVDRLKGISLRDKWNAKSRRQSGERYRNGEMKTGD